MTRQLGTSQFLKDFYMQREVLKQSVMGVSTDLRQAKLMATEGPVGQTLKSAAFFLWCAYLIDTHDECNSKLDIFRYLALFRADTTAVIVDLDKKTLTCQKRVDLWREDALVIWQTSSAGNSNSASRVTEVSLVALQQFCYSKANVDSPIDLHITTDNFELKETPTRTRHIFQGVPVVTMVWPTDSMQEAYMSILVVT